MNLKKEKRGRMPPSFLRITQDLFEWGRVEVNHMSFILRLFDRWERKWVLLSQVTVAVKASGWSLCLSPVGESGFSLRSHQLLSHVLSSPVEGSKSGRRWNSHCMARQVPSRLIL